MSPPKAERRKIHETLRVPDEKDLPVCTYPGGFVACHGHDEISPEYVLQVVEVAKAWGKKLGYLRVVFTEYSECSYADRRGVALMIGRIVAKGERYETDEEFKKRVAEERERKESARVSRLYKQLRNKYPDESFSEIMTMVKNVVSLDDEEE